MEVSQSQGLMLIEQVAALTGLPTEWVRQEMFKMVEQSGRGIDDLTLDDLRMVVLGFLNETALSSMDMPSESGRVVAFSN